MNRIHNFSIVSYYEAPAWKSTEQVNRTIFCFSLRILKGDFRIAYTAFFILRLCLHKISSGRLPKVQYYEIHISQNHVETAPPHMWLEVQQHPVFSPDSQSYLLLAPVLDDSRYFTHIKHVTRKDKHVRTISYGPAEVLQILAWDTINHKV